MWSVLGKQNVQTKKVYCSISFHCFLLSSFLSWLLSASGAHVATIGKNLPHGMEECPR